jgi:hypothetical protein
MFDVLLPVIVGGGIAIIGGLIGPPFLHHLQQKAEKKRRRAEKFEELIATLYEHHHWLTIVRNVRVFGLGEDRKVMSPIAKVQAISSVYFPEFEDQIRELDIAADQYEIWMMTAEQKRLKKDVTFADDAKEVYQPYLQKFHSLLRELREFAMREFQ